MWAVSSAVEHYVDIVVATGSIPVPPTICSFAALVVAQAAKFTAPPLGHNSFKAQSTARLRREQEKADEGQELAPLAEVASPRLPGRAPQRPCLCDQQDTKALQSPSGLN